MPDRSADGEALAGRSARRAASKQRRRPPFRYEPAARVCVARGT
ncbi:MAG TPA: hypothetical protein VFS67_37060 [Polyangiaceae bacterium]|nr:hypothetical protein [Polyangiaceae bacterium]